MVVPGCPNTETSNEDSVFSIPFQGPGLAPGYAKFYVFYRNETSGMIATMNILNPDNTVFNSWTRTSTTNYNNSYYGFSKVLPTLPGLYTFKAEYNGLFCEQQFTITTPVGINSLSSNSNFTIYPNPGNGRFTLNVSDKYLTGDTRLEIRNILGEIVFSKTITKAENSISIEPKAGIYFTYLINQGQILGTQKLIVN